jgi:hypothetical protein
MAQIVTIDARRTVPAWYAADVPLLGAVANVTHEHCTGTANDLAWLLTVATLASIFMLLWSAVRLLDDSVRPPLARWWWRRRRAVAEARKRRD